MAILGNFATGLDEFYATYGISKSALPKIAGRYSGGGCIVCADAACIWQDLERFGCRSGKEVYRYGWDFLTVNRLVATFPGRIAHAYSNSGAVLKRCIASRRDEYINEFGPPVATHSTTNETDWIWPWHGGGTSGLGAILTALALGYTQVVLAGMPLDNGPHNGEPPWRTTHIAGEAEHGDIHWQRAQQLAFKGKVKSLSGKTREWLGEPSA